MRPDDLIVPEQYTAEGAVITEDDRDQRMMKGLVLLDQEVRRLTAAISKKDDHILQLSRVLQDCWSYLEQLGVDSKKYGHSLLRGMIERETENGNQIMKLRMQIMRMQQGVDK